MDGLLLVIEGPDGAGKSTLASALVDRLAPLRAVVQFSFPTRDGEVGKLIRRAFAGDVELSLLTLGYLMQADMADSQVRLRRLIRDGVVVIADRYASVSSWAYQSDVFTTTQLATIADSDDVLKPDVTFILDAPPEVLRARIEGRGLERNRHFEKDQLVHVERLRRGYRAYAATHDDVHVLDATKSTDDMVERVLDALWIRNHSASGDKL